MIPLKRLFRDSSGSGSRCVAQSFTLLTPNDLSKSTQKLSHLFLHLHHRRAMAMEQLSCKRHAR